jgi:DNA-directed RNA polymerase subunit RPC12/RpoP
MARPSRRRQQSTQLQCNKCGRHFMGTAWFVSIETRDLDTIEWVPDRGVEAGNKCPYCGSMVVGFRSTDPCSPRIAKGRGYAVSEKTSSRQPGE